MDVLKDLLRIKQFREEQAELVLMRASQKLRDADAALDAARKALFNFQKACIEKERALYSDLCSRLVFIKELDAVAVDILLMKEEATKYEEALDSAETEREAAAELVLQAKLGHREAVRMREKFTELLDFAISEKDFALQRFEDLEMEESAGSRHAFLQAAEMEGAD
jgi:type III secretion protein O